MESKKETVISIIECLKAKKVLMIEALDITKQIEVQSKEEEIEIDSLVDERQLRVDRLKKCDLLIEKNIEILSDEKQRWIDIIKLKSVEIVTEEEKAAQLLIQDISNLCEKTIELDKIVTENMISAMHDAKQEFMKEKITFNKDKIFN